MHIPELPGGFWATVRKQFAIIMLSDRCLSCLSCPVCLSVLSVTLVYCGQTVGWIMHQDETWRAYRPRPYRHNVLDGDPPPPSQKGQSPQFSAHICFGQMYGWIKMPHCRELGLGQSAQATLCYMETQLPSSKRGRAPNFRSMSIVAKRLHGSRWHLAWRRASVQDILC